MELGRNLKRAPSKEEGDELPEGTVDLNADHIYSASHAGFFGLGSARATSPGVGLKSS